MTSAMVVRRAFEALADGGVEAMLEFVHPEGAMTTPPEFASEPDTYSGHDGLRRYFESFYEVMDRVDVEVHDLDEVGPADVIASSCERGAAPPASSWGSGSRRSVACARGSSGASSSSQPARRRSWRLRRASSSAPGG